MGDSVERLNVSSRVATSTDSNGHTYVYRGRFTLYLAHNITLGDTIITLVRSEGSPFFYNPTTSHSDRKKKEKKGQLWWSSPRNDWRA